MARIRGDLLVVSVWLGALVLASLPPLLNAAGVHSDAAVVGLQAMHLLRGEGSWFLWGSGYQTSVDVWVAAGYFWIFGSTPLALMLSTFVGYVLLVGLAYATLRRRFDPWSAALLVVPLVLMAPPAHIYAFYPPRQASLTLLFLAIWVLDGASASRTPTTRMTIGAFTAGLACYADPYCLLFLPAVALLIVLTAREGARGRAIWHVSAGLSGLVAGLVPFWLLSHARDASHGVYHLNFAGLGRNFDLLRRECLPFLLSTEVRRFYPVIGVGAWHPPGWFHAIQLAGAWMLVAGIVTGGALIMARSVPWDVRRLGAGGALMLIVTLSAFLCSVMALDRLSARYLVAIVLMAPFALAPLLHIVGRRKLAAMLAPYAFSAAVGGWLGYGDNVDGWRIRRDNGVARDEHELAKFFHANGLHAGLADYWVAYRLTFLFHEDPVVVPWHVQLDRHAAYRRVVDAAPVVAYVYDPAWSTEDLGYRESQFRDGSTGFASVFETARVGRYTVLVLHRRTPDPVRVATGVPPQPHEARPPPSPRNP